MMLKGKSISIDSDEIKLKPTKIVNLVEDVHKEEKSSLKPTTTISCSADSFQKVEYTQIDNINTKLEIITQIKNLRYSVEYIKEKIPGYDNLCYIELFTVLESTDFELNDSNLNLNLQKFINVGNNIQAQISKLNELLNFIPKSSFKNIKENINNKIGFFTSVDTFIALFDNFNEDVQNVYNILNSEIENVKNINFQKYNLIYMYFDFFKFISDELVVKNITTNDVVGSSIIASRLISLNNSITVLDQFKQLINVELHSKELELNNLKNYLNVLKPSLFLLKQQNFSSFKEQFKNLINN